MLHVICILCHICSGITHKTICIKAHYQRATIFMSLDRPQEALLELEKVRSAAPREASVHFNMGKVLKRLGQPAKAMRCFLTALDLDPKDNNLIKV